MLKKISLSLLVTLLFSQSVFAQQMNLKLIPKVSKLVTNHYLWTLSATCKIQSNSKNKIKVSVIKNKGIINGKNLSNGQGSTVTVNNNDSIYVSAESGAEVKLVNLGDEDVQAICMT